MNRLINLYAWAPHLLDVRGVRHEGLHLLPWRFAVAVRRAVARRFLEQKVGSPGALGSVATFLCTVTIIPFNGWEKSAGGFPAMVGNVAFLMKDVVLLAVSVYLLQQDLMRATFADRTAQHAGSFAIASFGDHTAVRAERTMK